jgi:hypothetical protein
MTLAAILVFSVVCASPAQPPAPTRGQTAPQAASAAKPDNAPAPAQDQATPPPAQSTAPSQPTPAATPAQKTTGQGTTKTAPRNHHRKRVLPPSCDPAAGGQTGSAPAASDPPTTKSAATPCPPPKVIVRQGGTSEPSIQLAGGTPGDQTSHERDTANQMLDTTQTNLKKIVGTQLNANQQDMVNQIHQYMDQSKAAVDAGDLDRARTLAWKAQVLSEELVKPKQ